MTYKIDPGPSPDWKESFMYQYRFDDLEYPSKDLIGTIVRSNTFGIRKCFRDQKEESVSFRLNSKVKGKSMMELSGDILITGDIKLGFQAFNLKNLSDIFPIDFNVMYQFRGEMRSQ